MLIYFFSLLYSFITPLSLLIMERVLLTKMQFVMGYINVIRFYIFQCFSDDYGYQMVSFFPIVDLLVNGN